MKSSLNRILIALAVFTICTGASWMRAGEAVGGQIEKYNVIWDSPSKDSSGSMPIGNGDVGMNVWVEENGDLLLLISKTDAWDENVKLLKIGRLRLRFSDSPFTKGRPFRQELKLHDGAIEISGGQGEDSAVLRIWVDANHPVIRVEYTGSKPRKMMVSNEPWRTQKKLVTDQSLTRNFGPQANMNGPGRPKEIECFDMPDTIVESGNGLRWYHRNEKSWWETSMKLQGLESMIPKMKDPLLHRTFGAAVEGTGLTKTDNLTLESAQPATAHQLTVHVLTNQSATSQQWLADLDRGVKTYNSLDPAAVWHAHQQWWHQFWNRSWIHLTGTPQAEMVSQAYALQRWVSACAGRGAMPIKFNGSIFTVEIRDGDQVKYDHDFREWGGDYWWQNTRLPYAPMLAAGDYEMMLPMFRMYLATFDLAKERSRIYYDCQGAFIPEVMSFFGLYRNRDYGWDRQGRPVSEVSKSIRWIWSSGLELSLMMLDYVEHTQDQTFLTNNVIPWADAMLQYYDTRFKRDQHGKLLISPAYVVESYMEGVVDPLTDIAGIRAVADRLLALPAELADPAARLRWTALREALPPLPMEQRDGKTILIPATRYVPRTTSEVPELYPVYPFRLYGVGKPDLDIARNTYAVRKVKRAGGWQQNPMFAAMLGMTDDAQKMISGMAGGKHGPSRFPAFWGPNYDWVPDQCHGGNLLNTAQLMLMQCEGDRIFLLPAWPRDWNASFKLHAPKNTTIEGVVNRGKIESLKVTPESRARDVVIREG